MAKVPALFLSEVDRAVEMSVLCAECVCYKTYCSSFCPRRVLSFAVRMRCASAAAGMHASMLSLVAFEMHKAMRPAQLRRLQAITCVHILCSLYSGNAITSASMVFIEGYGSHFAQEL